MSQYKKIKNEDVELNYDGKTIDAYIGPGVDGNVYLSMDIEHIKSLVAISEQLKSLR